MNLEVIANRKWPTPAPSVAVESIDQPSTNEVRLFEVTVVAETQLRLSGCVHVYATDADEAAEKVQGQIYDEVLDDDLEMEDWNGNVKLLYGDLKYCDDIDFQTGSVEVVEECIDPTRVLLAEVKELQTCISWNIDALAKHKAFLESLGVEQAVAA